MKILAVDDDPAILGIVDQFLGHSTQHKVDTVPSAKAALEAIADAEEPYDCFLCDIQMPEVDGISLVRLIRQSPGHETTPIIMLTAMHSKRDLDRAFEAGATDYVTKPFTCADLPPRLQAAQKLGFETDRRRDKRHQAGDVAGMGDDLKRVMLGDPIAIPGVKSAVGYTEFENYVSELLRRRTGELSTIAVKIGSVDHLHAKFTSEQFEQMLAVAATVVQDTLLAEGGVLSYRGNGTFLCIPEQQTNVRRRAAETDLNAQYQNRAKAPGKGAVKLIVGERVPLRKASQITALEALGHAVESVEAKSGTVSSAFLSEFFNAPKHFLGGLRIGREQQHLEKRAYESLLNDTVAEDSEDAWTRSLQRRAERGR